VKSIFTDRDAGEWVRTWRREKEVIGATRLNEMYTTGSPRGICRVAM